MTYYELLNESLVKHNVSHCFFAALPHHLRSQQHVTLIAYIVLQSLAHNVSEECADLQTHTLVHSGEFNILHNQMLRNFLF